MGRILPAIPVIVLVEVALKIPVSAEVGFPAAVPPLQFEAKTRAVPHLVCAVPVLTGVHVLLAANASVPKLATEPIATRATATARAKENFELMKIPFFWVKKLRKSAFERIDRRNLP